MTTPVQTISPGYGPVRGSKATGRSTDEWGARRVQFFDITGVTIGTVGAAGRITFDTTPGTGNVSVDFVPTAIVGWYKWPSGDTLVVAGYDTANKCLIIWDLTTGALAADASTPPGTFQVLVIGE